MDTYLDKERFVRISYKPLNTEEWFLCRKPTSPAMRAADVRTPGFPEPTGLPRPVLSARVLIGTPLAYGR